MVYRINKALENLNEVNDELKKNMNLNLVEYLLSEDINERHSAMAELRRILLSNQDQIHRLKDSIVDLLYFCSEKFQLEEEHMRKIEDEVRRAKQF